MTKTSKTLIFFGNERLVSGLSETDAPILRGLLERGYNVKAVVSHHTEANSRKPRPLEVATIAKQYDIPLYLPDRPMDIYDQLIEIEADAAVLVAYGRIIPQEIIDIFPLGIINIHPSLLPHYRGPTPIETPIVRGDTMSGVSIMQLSAGMDDGPVFAQDTFPISSTDTKFDVYQKAKDISTMLLFDNLDAILDESLLPREQNHEEATFSKLLSKKDGILNPEAQTASEADRMIRAYLGFPKSKLTILGEPRIITKAHVSKEQKTPLDVVFRDELYLSVDELIAPSGKTVTADAFLRGYSA
jgi:methionyl-tRNA formyltransferase